MFTPLFVKPAKTQADGAWVQGVESGHSLDLSGTFTACFLHTLLFSASLESFSF